MGHVIEHEEGLLQQFWELAASAYLASQAFHNWASLFQYRLMQNYASEGDESLFLDAKLLVIQSFNQRSESA